MTGQVIKGVDILDIIENINKRNKKYQAKFLEGLEQILIEKDGDYTDETSEKYNKIRKLFLDESNDYFRSTLKTIFGTDFEGTLR